MTNKNDDNKEKSWATIVLGDAARFLEGLTMGDKCQTRFKLIPTESLKANITNGKGTQAAIMDLSLAKTIINSRNKTVKSSQCTIRFDNPHKGADFHHINIDPQGISSPNNPHIPVPEGLISCAAKIDRCLKGISKGLMITAIIIDGIRIMGAIYEDINDKEHTLPHNTITTICKIAGGWAGGAAGATAGALVGAKIGTCIGTLFGGVGAVIGAPIGAAVGSIIGGIIGGHYGNRAGGYVARKSLDGCDNINGLLNCYVAGLIVYGNEDFLEAAKWNSVFQMSFVVMANPSKAVTDVFKGLNSDDPNVKLRALTAVGGAVYGGTVGTMVAGPVGTVVGGAVGLAVGAIGSWFKR